MIGRARTRGARLCPRLATRRAESSPRVRSEISWIAAALREHEMPAEEVGVVVGADDPEIVRRYFELHRERLQERLADRLVVLADLERRLTDARSRG